MSLLLLFMLLAVVVHAVKAPLKLAGRVMRVFSPACTVMPAVMLLGPHGMVKEEGKVPLDNSAV